MIKLVGYKAEKGSESGEAMALQHKEEELD
jgi:hypothetical protein